MLRAIIFVPRVSDSARWWKECVEYCQARDYCVVAIVARLEDVRKCALLHRATKVVLARRDHLVPDIPIEVISEQEQQPETPERRRPRRRYDRRSEDQQ